MKSYHGPPRRAEIIMLASRKREVAEVTQPWAINHLGMINVMVETTMSKQETILNWDR